MAMTEFEYLAYMQGFINDHLKWRPAQKELEPAIQKFRIEPSNICIIELAGTFVFSAVATFSFDLPRFRIENGLNDYRAVCYILNETQATRDRWIAECRGITPEPLPEFTTKIKWYKGLAFKSKTLEVIAKLSPTSTT